MSSVAQLETLLDKVYGPEQKPQTPAELILQTKAAIDEWKDNHLIQQLGQRLEGLEGKSFLEVSIVCQEIARQIDFLQDIDPRFM